MNYAGLPRREKSLVAASIRDRLKFEEVSANMRQLFGSRGDKVRRDVLLTEEAMAPRESDEDLEVWLAHRKANKKGVSGNKKNGAPKRSAGKVRGDGQTLDGFNRRTGKRRRRDRRDSEYHQAPKCPRRETPGGEFSPATQERAKATRPSYSPMSTDIPVFAQEVERLGRDERPGAREQSFSAPMDMGNLFLVSAEDSVVVLDTGATANLGCFRWLEQHTSFIAQHGF